MTTTTPKSVSTQTDPFILDVRTPGEYQGMHVPGSVLEPLHRMDPVKVREAAGDRTCYVLCRSGQRAAQAAEKLGAAGLRDVQVIAGGILAWAEAGLPVNRGRETMSIERQARIVAGFLVMAGVLLAQFTGNTAWMWLSGAVGFGLAFAGITNSCMMGLLLARMPWNNLPAKADKDGACCATN